MTDAVKLREMRQRGFDRGWWIGVGYPGAEPAGTVVLSGRRLARGARRLPHHPRPVRLRQVDAAAGGRRSVCRRSAARSRCSGHPPARALPRGARSPSCSRIRPCCRGVRFGRMSELPLQVGRGSVTRLGRDHGGCAAGAGRPRQVSPTAIRTSYSGGPASARGDRPRAACASRTSCLMGRAVWRARRDHARSAERRAAGRSGGAPGTTIPFVTHSIVEAVYLGQRVLVLAARPGRVQEVVDLRRQGRAAPRQARARRRPEAVAAMARLRQLRRGQVP